MSLDWKLEWQPVIDAVGQDFLDGEITWGADPIEPGAIRRFLEPLEFYSELHYDTNRANEKGYADIIMPYTGVIAWTLPPVWRPGEILFDNSDRNAQPVNSHINDAGLTIGPRTTGFFGTDIELDFYREVLSGERIGRRGKRLISCVPKETSVGRGAFLKWESEIITEAMEVVGLLRTGVYAYIPVDNV